MNAHSRISDKHTIEYSFESLDIAYDDLMFAEVSGVAELAMNDAQDGSFYVKHIILNGERFTKIGMSMLKRRKPSYVHLHRPADHSSYAGAHLFRMIEAAIYEDGGAHEAWASELEAA